jgi:Double-GTPase 2
VAELICPYCFQRAKRNKLHLRCPEECRTDAQYFPCVAQKCPHGRVPPTARFCPHCHNRLEYDYITTKSSIVAMIGSRESGKSTYVGVLIHELRNTVGTAFNGMSAELVGDSSRDRYRELFAGPLYQKGETVPVTDAIRAQRRLEPLLFMLRFPKARHPIGWNQLTAAMMIFYDTSGEDILKEDRLGRLAAYLDAAAGIIFVLDPLQISSVRRAIGNAAPLPENAPNQVEMIQRLAELLRERRKMTPRQRISTPFAVALAKTDALSGVLPEHSVLRQRRMHRGNYDDADGQHVHDEMRATLSSWADGDVLLNTVHNNFSTYRYFGFSALGSPPASKTQISPSGIHPLRVEDPMLWLLAQFGHIRVRRAKR